MKHRLTLIPLSLVLLIGTQVLADWDPEAEAQYEAERAAETRAEQERQRAADKQLNEARAKANKAALDSKRETLGAAAAGKSDAEVSKLYDAKIKRDTEAGQAAAKAGREALSQGQGAAALHQVTGKSLSELENMSDAEAEALQREMERKYGR